MVGITLSTRHLFLSSWDISIYAPQVADSSWMDLTLGTKPLCCFCICAAEASTSLCCFWFCFSLLIFMRYRITILPYISSPSVENQPLRDFPSEEKSPTFSHTVCAVSVKPHCRMINLAILHSIVKGPCVFVQGLLLKESNACCFLLWVNYVLN